eukprot:SAG31_NODE_2127_length_6390_cov_3.714036_3_plen_65_part_00
MRGIPNESAVCTMGCHEEDHLTCEENEHEENELELGGWCVADKHDIVDPEASETVLLAAAQAFP